MPEPKITVTFCWDIRFTYINISFCVVVLYRKMKPGHAKLQKFLALVYDY